MNLMLALTLFSSPYNISLEYSITLTYVFIQSLNSTGLFSSVIKKAKKTSKANCMDLTFVLLHENSSNKCVAFKYFMSYFGFERSDLVMQNYVVISGLQASLKSSNPTHSILFDNFKLCWPFCFPAQGFAFHDNLTILVPLSQSKRWHFRTHVTLLCIFIFSIVSVEQSGQREYLLLECCDLRWTQSGKRWEWPRGKTGLRRTGYNSIFVLKFFLGS